MSEYDDLKRDVENIKNKLQDLNIEQVRNQGKDKALENIILQLEKDINNLDTYKVSKIEFAPVQKITYGVVAVVLLTFITAIVSLVIAPNKGTDYNSTRPLSSQNNYQRQQSANNNESQNQN